MRLIVVRHGETLYNVHRRFTGQSDVPLSELGEQQAEALGQHLSTMRLDVIVASDLQRARATAQAIAPHHGLPVEEDADLREMAFGGWESATYAEVLARYATLVQRWQSDPTLYAPPGGETGLNVLARALRVARECALQHEIIHGHPTRMRWINNWIGQWPLALWLLWFLVEIQRAQNGPKGYAPHSSTATSHPLRSPRATMSTTRSRRFM